MQDVNAIRLLVDIAIDLLFPFAVFGLVFLTLYLPSLITARVLFPLKRRKGPIVRLLSYPIGPSVPGRGADRRTLRRALRRWTMLGLKAVSLVIASAAIASGYWLFAEPADDWLTVAWVIVTFTALFTSVVSAVECAFLLVRLAFPGPSNPTSALPLDTAEPPSNRVNPPEKKTNGFTRVLGTHSA